ncbi:6-phospho-3-hexuloisomerase [Roseomonas sp. OT10]|uniref:6-phospho-3-hexuloisomerase n=1 Tax=Roseomonas cutis TaxID=2897332 RepID=UPI001E4F3738|nr:6-phospho-3-hexuloisomerase [Roseomonas sp. OT10]UFN49441.1 6-phospho-3-hexuloisomerase [Roseomonas sp. OT10]
MSDVGPWLDELHGVFARLPAGTLDAAVEAVEAAPRLLLWGAGRAGLALQALAMRLHQSGRDAHWLGDVTVPPLRPGDLLLVNASRGDLPRAVALLRQAGPLGVQRAVLTAAAAGPALDAADLVLRLPAQAWEGDGAPVPSTLPMGGQYELALWLFGDLLIRRLAARAGQEMSGLAARHANLG